jgi:uncharacterized protein with GYD domain
MPHYLYQVSYSREGWQALMRDPQDRMEKIRPAVEELGGSLVGGWFAFGADDIVALVEFPDNSSAAAFSIAAAAGGAVESIRTTTLLSTQEAMDAMRKANESSYRPPGG